MLSLFRALSNLSLTILFMSDSIFLMSTYPSPRSRRAESAMRILAGIGFVSVLVVGMYFSVQAAKAVPDAFRQAAAAIISISSIFVPANETLTLKLSTSSVESGTPVTVAFAHTNKSTDGAYAFRYSCADGVTLTTASQEDPNVSIACNQPFAFEPFNDAIVLVPTAQTAAAIEIFISFTPSTAGTGSPTVVGSAALTISAPSRGGAPLTTVQPPVPEPKPLPTPAPKPPRTTIVVPQGRQSDPNGFTDLTARIIETGVIDANGAFIASSTPNRTSRVAVRFAVENIGTKTSKEFTFSAVLPTYPPFTYFSPSQVALGPGDRIEFTIGFDSFEQDNVGDFIVNVDPTSSVNERNKDNNIVKYTVTVTK